MRQWSLHPPVVGTVAGNIDYSTVPGAFWFNEHGSILTYVCPCGCNEQGRLPLYPLGTEKPAATAWSWDGDREKPTLSPSIRRLDRCQYHGHLEEGVWTFAADSGGHAREVHDVKK